jgi:4-amino-4-deoxy-L-arabinose transferase-like glycosyltransferase
MRALPSPMVAALLIIAISWLGCYAICRELAHRQRISQDWRVSWLLACVVWGVILTLIVEISSEYRAFAAATMQITLSSIGLLLLTLAFGAARRRRGAYRVTELVRQIADDIRKGALQIRRSDARLLYLTSGVIAAALGAIALRFPTTNWDSMTYHLSRVMHWIQQHSVAHYPTMNGRQLEFGPWSEFVIATLYLLVGDDRLATTVQWFSMVSALVAASLIAGHLFLASRITGGSAAISDTANDSERRISAFAVLLSVTIPIGITESITTQNDYVVAFWYVCSLHFALALLSHPTNIWYTLALGGAVGLGTLTKSTMVICVTPALFIMVTWTLLRLRYTRLRLRLVAILFGMVLLMNLPHMLRNLGLYHSPLGSNETRAMLCTQRFSVGGLASNVIRNLALHSTTGSSMATNGLNRLLFLAHAFTGRELSDPDTTFPYTPFFWKKGTDAMSDSDASCPIHVLLIFGAFALIAVRNRRPLLWLYTGVVVLGFLLLCLLLRWQPWNTRFHLAYLVALMPVVAIAVVEYLPKWLTTCLVALVTGWTVYIISANISCPLNPASDFATQPREQQYFLHNPGLYDPYRRATEDIVKSGCRQVGLKLNFEDWEYPIWLMLRNRGFEGTIGSAFVQGVAARLPSSLASPCALIAFGEVPDAKASGLVHKVRHGPVTVYFAPDASVRLGRPVQE